MNDQERQSISELLAPEILKDIMRVTQGRIGKGDIDHLASALLETKQQLSKVRAERDKAIKQRDALAEALQEMRYGHTDKAEKMTIESLKYPTK
jgi:hypothetical protein